MIMVMFSLDIMIPDLEVLLHIEKIKPNILKDWLGTKDGRKGMTPWQGGEL